MAVELRAAFLISAESFLISKSRSYKICGQRMLML